MDGPFKKNHFIWLTGADEWRFARRARSLEGETAGTSPPSRKNYCFRIEPRSASERHFSGSISALDPPGS